MARKGKTLEQQCKYYNCEDFVRDVISLQLRKQERYGR